MGDHTNDDSIEAVEVGETTVFIGEEVDSEALPKPRRGFKSRRSKYQPILDKLLELEPGKALPLQADDPDELERSRMNVYNAIKNNLYDKGVVEKGSFAVYTVSEEDGTFAVHRKNADDDEEDDDDVSILEMSAEEAEEEDLIV